MELTVPAAVARAARDFGDAEALADTGRVRLSYRELDERVTAVTGALIDAGIGPGDRVARVGAERVASGCSPPWARSPRARRWSR